jgi:hypothetical protein
MGHDVLTWLTGQSIAAIAVIVFGAWYLLSALIVAGVAITAQRGYAPAFKAALPVTLTPIAVTYALLVGFLAADVWPIFDRARSAVGMEASKLREVVIVADALPKDARAMLRNYVREHIDAVVTREWPAMANGSQTLKDTPPALRAALIDLLSMNFPPGGQQLAQQRAVAAIEDALDARRERIFLSQATLGGTKVFVLVLLACLVLVTIAMMHVDNRTAQVIAVVIFATAAAATMLAIFIYDRPFGGGGISLAPTVLLDVRPEQSR